MTRTAEEDAAILTLDHISLADADEARSFCQACGQPVAQAGLVEATKAGSTAP